MKNLFVPYELAVNLKEKGFDEPCLTHYDTVGKLNENDAWSHCTCENSDPDRSFMHCAAPLWQQVIDWLREEKEVHIELERIRHNRYKVKINFEYMLDELHFHVRFDSYYSALQSGIEKALELI